MFAGALKRFSLLKKQNPRLTIMVAVGGWNEGSARYSEVLANGLLDINDDVNE